MWAGRQRFSTPTPEDIRKRAQLLIIDDHDVPFQALFERDGYHIERWAAVENVSRLTDGYFDIILLDLHGVGLKEDAGLQGLGVLRHVKETNPAQLVVAYSAQPWSVSFSDFFALADAVLDKGDAYLQFKGTVDTLLTRRYSVGYFIAKINDVLGDHAAAAPSSVSKALRSIERGTPQPLARYLAGRITDEATIDRVLTIVGIAISVLK